MKQAYRILKPGVGWVQCVDFNAFFKCDDNSVPKEASIWKVCCPRTCADYSIKKRWKGYTQATTPIACFMVNISKRQSQMEDSWTSLLNEYIYTLMSWPKVSPFDQTSDCQDPRVGTPGLLAFTGSVRPLVEYLTSVIPDKNERIALADKVVADILNPEYNLYCDTYYIIFCVPLT